MQTNLFSSKIDIAVSVNKFIIIRLALGKNKISLFLPRVSLISALLVFFFFFFFFCDLPFITTVFMQHACRIQQPSQQNCGKFLASDA